MIGSIIQKARINNNRIFDISAVWNRVHYNIIMRLGFQLMHHGWYIWMIVISLAKKKIEHVNFCCRFLFLNKPEKHCASKLKYFEICRWKMKNDQKSRVRVRQQPALFTADQRWLSLRLQPGQESLNSLSKWTQSNLCYSVVGWLLSLIETNSSLFPKFSYTTPPPPQSVELSNKAVKE